MIETGNRVAQLVNQEDLENIAPLIRGTNYTPYLFLEKIKDVDSKGYTLLKLQETFQHDLSKIFVAQRDSQIDGLASLKLLPWDENIFKIKMATIPHLLSAGDYKRKKEISSRLLSRIMEACTELRIEHISARIDSQDMASIHALEEFGFQLMDILTYFVTDMHTYSIKQIKTSLHLREFKKTDIEDVMEVARHGFRDYSDRFHVDPHLESQHCDNLYAEWAQNSCLGYADKVFVAEKDKAVIGFITARIHKDVENFATVRLGEMELVVVSQKARHGLMGVFPHLVDFCMNWFKKNADFVLGKTLINNIQVQQKLQKNGFKLAQTQCTFHKWIN